MPDIQKPLTGQHIQSRAILQVSTYDRVAGLIIALLVVVGFLVLLLFLIWLTKRVLIVTTSVPVKLVEAGGAEGSMGADKGFEDPESWEGEDLVETEIEDTLAAITDVVSTKLASLEELEFGHAGAGAGGALDKGPGGHGDADVIPRWERWEIRYNSDSRSAYAKQLDHFGIELGVTGGGTPNVQYASNLSGPKPLRRSGSPNAEERLYMTWRGGPLQRADAELLQAAGIETDGRILVQFFPPEVEQALARLEQLEAGKRDVTEIRKTVFGVRGDVGQYEFYVIEQQFRTSQ